MRNKVRNISLYIISMRTNLPSLYAALCSKWYVRKKTDWLTTKVSQRADFLVREKVALTHVKQQHLVGTVKRIWLCEPEPEHTLKHREQKNNLVVDWACLGWIGYANSVVSREIVIFTMFC
jgi:hypothetical protein